MKIKVRIPVVTVEVDVEEWAEEYGLEPTARAVRDDVKIHCLSQIDNSYAVVEELLRVVR